MTDRNVFDLNDPKYIPLLDHGFIYLVDHMGSDAAIVQAARVSYGSGTKSVREDRGLIRYLMRLNHSSPFEMAEVKFHIKLPIFVFRQMVRHRTANVNEYSGRYSVMSNEFYIPDSDSIAGQSTDNKQGRGGEIDNVSKRGVKWFIKTASEITYDIYKTLLGPTDGLGKSDDCPYAPYDVHDPLLSDDFPGIAREIARTVLPVNNYTELYWKQDLRNLFHLIKLRADSHAQKEIRVYAEAMYQLIEPLFPAACEAAQDYLFKAHNASRMDIQLIHDAMESGWNKLALKFDNEKAMADAYGMSVRELNDFKTTFVR